VGPEPAGGEAKKEKTEFPQKLRNSSKTKRGWAAVIGSSVGLRLP